MLVNRLTITDIPTRPDATLTITTPISAREIINAIGGTMTWDTVEVPDPPEPESIGCPICDAGHDHDW